jgi:hypothetical protein
MLVLILSLGAVLATCGFMASPWGHHYFDLLDKIAERWLK